MVTWDEPKRQANLRDHGIDFADCETIFDAPMLTSEDDRMPYGEQRLQSVGLLCGRVVLVVWVDCGDSAHLISVRKATKREERDYWKAI